jgi:asparagine synthase (glutamine-hydrolysing)
MCGIAGVFDASQATPDAALLQAMGDAIAHRGPDQEGFFRQPGVGLVSRRLRIIDLEGGAQPIHNETGQVTVVYNGEIYNFESLREELARRGHQLATRTDTEVLVHFYEELGRGCLTPMRGMFAVALWDAEQRTGLLARDRLGKKPVVYAQVGSRLYFASEIQALLHCPDIPRGIDLGALGDYLAHGYVPAPATIYRAIRKLPPGHTLSWRDGEVSVQPYWTLDYQPKLRLSEADALEELERRLDEAVRLRLIADVPLGALLSGGVDSSVVVALMSRHSPGRVKTFSVGFDDAAYDELAHARRVAERYDTDHHEFVVQPRAADILPMLVRHYGEPYADSSAIPTFYVSKLAREHVTVALNGDGGDEAFAGYDRYRGMVWAERSKRVLDADVAQRLGVWGARHAPFVPTRQKLKLERFFAAARVPTEARYSMWMSLARPALMDQLLTPELREAFGSARSFAVEQALSRFARLGMVDRLLATDVATYLPFDLLVKMDIASMANSLETRSPLLDQEVVEFAARLPSNHKLHNGLQQKYLLKQLARKLIPPENIDRPKMGFAVPVGGWLRGALREIAADALLSHEAAARGYFVPAVVRRIWDEHQSQARDHTSLLWGLLMLELWHRDLEQATTTDAGAAQSPAPSIPR